MGMWGVGGVGEGVGDGKGLKKVREVGDNRRGNGIGVKKVRAGS